MVIDNLYKSHVYKTLYKDLSKFVRKNMKNMDFDREYWLHKVGLTPYRPTKAAFGGMSLFILGTLAGGIAGLFFAPKPGTQMRTDVRDRAKEMIERRRMSETRIPTTESQLPV